MYRLSTCCTPTSDTDGTSFHIRTPSGEKYIFGSVPEGSQRAVTQQKQKLSKLSTVFLTGELNWRTIGGLPGMILTTSDQGKKDMKIISGNDILNYVISTWRSFIFRFGMELKPVILSNETAYDDDTMIVKATNLTRVGPKPGIGLNSKQTSKLQVIVNSMFPLKVSDRNMKDESDPRDDSQHVNISLPEISPHQASTCYSLQFKPVRGKFQLEKAKELGIPRGKLYAQLASGEEVTLEDGRTIKPDQVLSEPRVFQPILFIDIPSKDYLESAFAATWPENVSYVYHMLGKDVDISTEEYARFLSSFGPGCQHGISHPLYSPNSITYEASALAVLKLKSLMKDNYNLPASSASQLPLPEGLKNAFVLSAGFDSIIQCSIKSVKNDIQVSAPEADRFGANYWEGLYENGVRPLNLQGSATKEDTLDFNNVSSLKVDSLKPLKNNVETITFGTGSALPSKYRNVISSLVRIPYQDENGTRYRSVLLDGGENTIGTMKRYLGDDLESYFKELQLIYLSHLHADHHLGLVSIIKEWFEHNKDISKKLYVVTPWQYDHFIQEWFKIEKDYDIGNRLVYISCESFLRGKRRDETKQISFDDFIPCNEVTLETTPPPASQIDIQEMTRDLGIRSFATCRAYHCNWAYCCSIIFDLRPFEENENFDESKFKVSYSGDTRPVDYMFAGVIGKNSDLLIHEATLENELLEDAKKKRHCTINEAIEVSNKMRAKKLILTHFSQRYPKLPKISNNISIDADFCYAFDSMIVKYDAIHEQQAFFDQLDKAFLNEGDEEMDLLED